MSLRRIPSGDLLLAQRRAPVHPHRDLLTLRTRDLCQDYETLAIGEGRVAPGLIGDVGAAERTCGDPKRTAPATLWTSTEATLLVGVR